MNPLRISIVSAGAAFALALAFIATNLRGEAFIAGLQAKAERARVAAGGDDVKLSFRDRYGWLSRHPVLSGGDQLDDPTRARVAAAVAEVAGIGGITWDSSKAVSSMVAKLQCQDDVDAILATRTIRFGEASTRIDPASARLLDEVANALRPCVGSIIAVTGHTDAISTTEANKVLSLGRAEAVRSALISRGIPSDGLRATGVGASQPIAGLSPDDPANRRIEFSVIVSAPVKPTPIDTPGAD